MLSVSVASSDSVYKKICDGKEKCRAIVVPKKIQKEGTCSGLILEKYLCLITYNSNGSAFIDIKCRSDSGEILINNSFQTNSLSYNLLAIVEKNHQEDEIISEKKDYLSISSEILDMLIIQNNQTPIPVTEASINLLGKSRQFRLTQVSCSQ